MTEPNELPPDSYEDRIARGPTPIDLAAPHEFTVSFPESHFRFAVNEVEEEFDVGKMPKVFGPGLVRFRSFSYLDGADRSRCVGIGQKAALRFATRSPQIPGNVGCVRTYLFANVRMCDHLRAAFTPIGEQPE